MYQKHRTQNNENIFLCDGFDFKNLLLEFDQLCESNIARLLRRV